MKIYILNTIIQKIKTKEKASLYGYQHEAGVVICSLEQKHEYKQVCFHATSTNTVKHSTCDIVSVYNGVEFKFFMVEEGKLIELEYTIVNYETDFHARNQGLIDSSVLQSKTITIIGLGSGGSAISTALLRSGVTNQNLVEYDTVEASNICRSKYNVSDIGRKKVNAIHDQLMRINPNANIQLYDENILKMDGKKLRQIIAESDLIIECTDNIQSKLLINGKAHNSTAVLYPAVYSMGVGSDLLVTLPGLPCYECTFSSILDEMKATKQREWDYTSGEAVSMPGLIADIQVIVARTVKLALAILTGNQENSMFDKITEPGCTLLVISNEHGGVSFLDKPFQEEWIKTEINPECSCQTLC